MEESVADILILANSKKNKGFCVAGKDVMSNKWVRIVGDQNGAELNLNQLRYNDLAGRMQMIQFEPFNKVISLDFDNEVPLCYQPENILIGQKFWQEIQLAQHNVTYDTPVDLWGAGDRIKATDIEQGLVNIPQSLYLIQVTNLHFYINDFNSNRAYFQYGHNTYDLGATMNPSIFYDLFNGVRAYNNILTVSLAGPFFNRHTNQYEHYKLVAAVF
jgi:hypothetical protein